MACFVRRVSVVVRPDVVQGIYIFGGADYWKSGTIVQIGLDKSRTRVQGSSPQSFHTLENSHWRFLQIIRLFKASWPWPPLYDYDTVVRERTIEVLSPSHQITNLDSPSLVCKAARHEYKFLYQKKTCHLRNHKV